MANSTVTKVIEVSASSGKGIEDAMQSGLKKVSKTVKGIKGAWVNEIKVVTGDDGSITEWRVNMRVSFVVS
ncbi:MAG TPA: dodecin family protein [Arenimonas sp.]|jgi:flavin-binding protein dodecin|nr:dodecin family protein [Arenimonas sp.]